MPSLVAQPQWQQEPPAGPKLISYSSTPGWGGGLSAECASLCWADLAPTHCMLLLLLNPLASSPLIFLLVSGKCLLKTHPAPTSLLAPQKEVGLHPSAYLEAGACSFQWLQPSSLTSALPQSWERGEHGQPLVCSNGSPAKVHPLVQAHTPFCLVHLHTMNPADTCEHCGALGAGHDVSPQHGPCSVPKTTHERCILPAL